MQADILAWAVPGSFLAFAVGFALLGRLASLLYVWSGCFALAAVGFAMTIVPTPEGSVVKPLVEDGFFLLALAGASVAFAMRLGRRPLFRALALTFLASLGAAGLALVLYADARLEIFAIQSGCAVMMVLSAATMRGPERGIDQVLFWICLFVAASLTLQNLVFFAAPLDAPMTVANWRESPWAFVFQLSGAATGILIAFAVLIAIGLDLIEHHRESSQLDALTLVLNRRGFERRAAELRRAAGRRASVALVMADLDFFKRVNDRHGHAAGDAVLCGFAALLGRMSGDKGCVARLGGEEFVVLLRDCDKVGAQHFASEVQSALRQVRWPFASDGLSITASFGVVELEADEQLGEAVKRADSLLYIAKTHGRDRVVTDAIAAAKPPEPPALFQLS